ncbi:hypothetical protein RIR_jg27366.t1 [Rhizophagus irregularis DAOM 181602=DAOM 197198]|nr:hypothetical protein RIR_jg27366.t1 [Rhizophagus irregularis DAOM 181602=DAOM 197198]CAG8641470.1 12598_t:CDS:2 [Rhizophagus irregularis]
MYSPKLIIVSIGRRKRATPPFRWSLVSFCLSMINLCLRSIGSGGKINYAPSSNIKFTIMNTQNMNISSNNETQSS